MPILIAEMDSAGSNYPGAVPWQPGGVSLLPDLLLLSNYDVILKGGLKWSLGWPGLRTDGLMDGDAKACNTRGVPLDTGPLSDLTLKRFCQARVR